MATKKSGESAQPKRNMFAFDLDPKWTEALREVAAEYYPHESSPTGLVRQWVQELVGCFMTEKEMKDRGLIPFYRSQGRPELILFAIRKAEELRRQNGG